MRDDWRAIDRAVLLFAALTHDFAKADTTELREKEGVLRWTAYGHEHRAGPLARRFFERASASRARLSSRWFRWWRIIWRIAQHRNGRDAARRSPARLRLAPASIEQLVRLIEADASGRPPQPRGLPGIGRAHSEVAARAESVAQKPQAPLILGRHVLPYFDDQPGEHIGEVTRAAYEAQADGAFSNETEALRWLAQRMRRR